MKKLINKSFFGDCLTLMEVIPDKSIDLIFADLPYGKTKNKWDVKINLTSLWDHYNRIIKDNGVILLFADQPFTSELIMSNSKMFRYNWVWEKTSAAGFLNAKKMPMRAHEDICVFYKKLPIYNPQKTTGHRRKYSSAHHKRNSIKTSNYGDHKFTGYDSTERYPRSVLKFSLDKQKRKGHATQKPIKLLKYFIETYTNLGAIVLDNVAGSGGTGVACRELNRNYILMEKDPEIFKLIEAENL
jgi:site-specific DNA-methyltransferase (adenine-specific)